MIKSKGMILAFLLGATSVCSADDALLIRHESAAKEAEKSIREYHELIQSESPDEAAVHQAHQSVVKLLKRSIEFELDLREQRIASAQKRLDAVSKKLSENRKSIDRVVDDSLTEKLAMLSGPPARVFPLPIDAINFMEEKVRVGEFREMVRTVLTDNAVKDFAGAMMLSSVAGSSIKKMASGGTEDVIGNKDLALVGKMEQLLKKHRAPKPDEKTLAAFKKVSEHFVNGLLANEYSAGQIDMDDFRTATDLISDHRAFVIDFLEMLHRHSGEVLPVRSPDGSKINWSVMVHGGSALAVSTKHVDQSNSPKLRLVKQDGGWLISSLLTDEMLQQCLSGPQAVRPIPAQTENALPPFRPAQSISPYAAPTPAMPPPAVATPSPTYPYNNLSQPAIQGFSPTAVVPPKSASTDSLPLYSGQNISMWLNELQTNLFVPGDTSEAVKAVKTLAAHPSSDPYVRSAMAKWYSHIKNELNTDFRKRQAELIVFVGNERHQELALDYMFQIATEHQVLSKKVALEFFEEDFYLRDAIFAWKNWNAETASLLAERIRDGDSQERIFALVFPLIYCSRGSSEDTETADSWFSKNRDVLEPALILALKDKDEFVRQASLEHLLTVMPMTDTIAASLIELLKTEDNGDMLSAALATLVKHQPDSDELHETMLAWAKSDDSKKYSAVFSAWSSDQTKLNRPRNVAEMAELLQDPDWGRKSKLNWFTGDSIEGEEPLRKHVIGLLKEYRGHAAEAVPVLQKEVARNDTSTKELAQKAIDSIEGYCKTVSAKKLQGRWTLSLDHAPVGGTIELAVPLVPPDETQMNIDIRGTEVFFDDQLFAHLSNARGQRENQVRFVSIHGNKKGHYVGTFVIHKEDPFDTSTVDGEILMTLTRVFPNPGPPVTLVGNSVPSPTMQKFRFAPLK